MEFNPDQPNPDQPNPGAAPSTGPTSTGPAAQPLPPPHPDSRGYYAALHILPGASQQEISRAFRAQMRQRHPDVRPSGGSGGSGGQDASGVLAAFAVLRDPRTRADYDRAEQAAVGATTPEGPQGIPVRLIRRRGPLLRVSPVRWERGP